MNWNREITTWMPGQPNRHKIITLDKLYKLFQKRQKKEIREKLKKITKGAESEVDGDERYYRCENAPYCCDHREIADTTKCDHGSNTAFGNDINQWTSYRLSDDRLFRDCGKKLR